MWEKAARRWLERALAGTGKSVPSPPVDTWLPDVRHYAEVTRPPEAIDTTAIAVKLALGDGPELAPQSEDDRETQRIRTAERGHDAEEAMLTWVTAKTRALVSIHGDAAWDVLEAAAPNGGNLFKALRTDRNEGAPTRRGLHVSKLWGNAGYDLLGLAETGGRLVAARYEVKGLPGDARRLRFFLSRNELGVARRCRASGEVWMLVGVREDGRSLDLTPIIGELLDLDDSVLAVMAQAGISPDGFVIHRTLADVAVSGAKRTQTAEIK